MIQFAATPSPAGVPSASPAVVNGKGVAFALPVGDTAVAQILRQDLAAPGISLPEAVARIAAPVETAAMDTVRPAAFTGNVALADPGPWSGTAEPLSDREIDAPTLARTDLALSHLSAALDRGATPIPAGSPPLTSPTTISPPAVSPPPAIASGYLQEARTTIPTPDQNPTEVDGDADRPDDDRTTADRDPAAPAEPQLQPLPPLPANGPVTVAPPVAPARYEPVVAGIAPVSVQPAAPPIIGTDDRRPIGSAESLQPRASLPRRASSHDLPTPALSGELPRVEQGERFAQTDARTPSAAPIAAAPEVAAASHPVLPDPRPAPASSATRGLFLPPAEMPSVADLLARGPAPRAELRPVAPPLFTLLDPAVGAPAAAPAPAHRVFGPAMAAIRQRDRVAALLPAPSDLLGVDAAALSPASSPIPVVPIPTPPVDLTDAQWPHAMMARIEALRDAADAVDTRVRVMPDALGMIDIDVRRDGDTVHVRFTAEQPQTRVILQDAQPRLAEAAEARGLRLGQTAVDGGTFGAGASGSNGSAANTPHGGQHRQPAPDPHRAPVAPITPRDRTADAAEDARIA